ncbi:hypothetical protein [Ferrovibrio terrae]|uniref:hypothetical protein n=1 Tax=Ferrovibrio terrae TaxID=2594003 RepID=UPI0031384354
MMFTSLINSPTRRALALVAILGSMTACSAWNSSAGGSGDAGKPGSGPPTQIAGVALPDGYSLDSNRTIILGEGDRWIGRLSYSVNSSADAMFDFIRREMANYGWTEVAVVRAEASQLTFLSGGGDRVASVLISRSTLYGSKVDMTVAPSTGSTVTSAPRAAGNRPR